MVKNSKHKTIETFYHFKGIGIKSILKIDYFQQLHLKYILL